MGKSSVNRRAWDGRADDLLAAAEPYAEFGAFREWAREHWAHYLVEWDELDAVEQVAVYSLVCDALEAMNVEG